MTRPPMLRRVSDVPILTREDIPDVPPRVHDPTSVFNPGAIRLNDRVFLVLRVQTRGRETVFMIAESRDGRKFRVRPTVVEIDGAERIPDTIHHVYDPRLTRIDDIVYMTFAADVEDGCRVGIAATRDLENFELISFDRNRDQRNAVLFPQRIDGRFAMLSRPNKPHTNAGVSSGDEIVLMFSDDLEEWRIGGSVLRGRSHYWDELIGSGAPPIRARAGWLHIYHGIATHFSSCNIYQAGAVLLDLEDPTKLLGRTHNNILEPRMSWEHMGQVPNVVFPSGAVVSQYDHDGFALHDSRIDVYYGAADTCIGLAETTVAALIDSCSAD